jgi:hypothetical protein
MASGRTDRARFLARDLVEVQHAFAEPIGAAMTIERKLENLATLLFAAL